MAEINYAIEIEDRGAVIDLANKWIWELEVELDTLLGKIYGQFAEKVVEVLRKINPKIEETESDFVSSFRRFGLSPAAKTITVKLNAHVSVEISRKDGFVSASLDGFGAIEFEQIPMALVLAPEVFRNAERLQGRIEVARKALEETA